MPAQFLTDAERARLSGFPEELTEADLAAHFGIEIGAVEDDGEFLVFECGCGREAEVVAVPDSHDPGFDRLMGKFGLIVGWLDDL